jgi:hypothetical protein
VLVTATLGYARVSTVGQDLEVQLVTLSAAGMDRGRVFTDTLSGSARTARPGLAALLAYARSGDTVVVAAIDRLGRCVAEVTRTIADLGERGITLRALREGVTPPPRRDGRWPRSWQPLPSLSLSWGVSVVPVRPSRGGSPPVIEAEPLQTPGVIRIASITVTMPSITVGKPSRSLSLPG